MNKQLMAYLIMGVAAVALVLVPFVVPKYPSRLYLHNDFYDYWIGSKLWWSHKSPFFITDEFKQWKNKYSLEFHWASGYSYPPWLAMVFYPVQWGSPKTTAWGWYGLNGLLYLAFVWRWYKRTGSLAVIAFLLTFVPAVASLMTGQINIIILWLFEVVWFGKKPMWRGICLSLIAIIKVYPLILATIWVKNKKVREWRYFLVAMIIWVLLPMIGFGAGETVKYVVKVLPWLQSSADPYFVYQGVPSIVSRFNPESTRMNKYLSYAVMILLAVLLLSAVKRSKNEMLQMMVMLSWLTLVSGRNTFWNFLPLIYLYLWSVIHFGKLKYLSKVVAGLAILGANGCWHLTYLATNPIVLMVGGGSLILILGVVIREQDRIPFFATMGGKTRYA